MVVYWSFIFKPTLIILNINLLPIFPLYFFQRLKHPGQFRALWPLNEGNITYYFLYRQEKAGSLLINEHKKTSYISHVNFSERDFGGVFIWMVFKKNFMHFRVLRVLWTLGSFGIFQKSFKYLWRSFGLLHISVFCFIITFLFHKRLKTRVEWF